ncbi:putative transcriptional regulator [Alloactinosynnema sp. L-07]|uniref:response regulator transcription factor n=1 Tax=Alloactinosynnema sp. L-07 TaxID=1653480 RepID=UPI00065EF055|nr:helix-turn-helix transcriptional regulator [Alloactinosynnema sp. L-07]CRK57843.1 putative transcriptional regulator [Alloactinosynnema sp. L-07]
MDDKLLAEAVRIGAALGTAGTVEWDQVLHLLRRALPGACATQLTGWDPVDRRFHVITEDGYSRAVSTELAYELPRTRWGTQLFESPTPLLMDDMPHNFRDSPHYQNRLAPAGFEDGLSAALSSPAGTVVGVLHMNAPVRHAFDETTRSFVASVGAAMARRVDPLHCPRLDAWFGPEWAASWLVPSVSYVPGRQPSPVADDPALLALADAFARLRADTLPFLWQSADGWHRSRFLRVTKGPHVGVVIATTPFANTLGLTARELDVATGLVAGLSNQAIAEILVVSRRTVETYVERLLTKLDCQTRGETAGVAARAGLIRPTDPTGIGALARLTRGTDPDWG